MKLLSLKAIALRYVCAVILITLAALISRPDAWFMVIPVAVVSLKFLIYDGILATVNHKVPTLKVRPWILIGYGLTVVSDTVFVYGASLDSVDAGFAFFGTILVTPWILGVGLVTIGVATYVSRKK